MSIIVSVIILILSMLIPFFMQLIPGAFSLFYHNALGKTTAKKADDRSLSFILGVEIFTVLIWLIVYSLTFLLFYHVIDSSSRIFPYVMAGIFIAEAFAVLLFYYRRGKSTALFISRRIANSIVAKIEKHKNRSDCILLGAIIGIFELIFVLPCYIMSSAILVNSTTLPHILIVIAFPIISILPLFAVRNAFRFGSNLAEIQRFRVKIKPSVRFTLFISFILLAACTIYLGVINHG